MQLLAQDKARKPSDKQLRFLALLLKKTGIAIAGKDIAGLSRKQVSGFIDILKFAIEMQDKDKAVHGYLLRALWAYFRPREPQEACQASCFLHEYQYEYLAELQDNGMPELQGICLERLSVDQAGKIIEAIGMAQRVRRQLA